MIPANRQIHAKLEIIRPSGRVDVTPYLEAAEVELGSIEDLGTGTGADIGVRTLTFSLRNDGQMVRYWGTEDVLGDSEDILGDSGDVANLGAILGEGKLARNSFAPRDKASGWNLVGGKWEPLLWPYRGAVFQVAVTAPGETPTNWITLFEGYLGDNITTEPHRVTVRCRDKSKRLQDAYIDIPKVYEDEEGIPAETLIQSIINEYVDDPPTLYCPVPSGITFDEMKVEYVSVWDAIQNVAKQMGWFLGYRWNGTSYSLTFIEPPRSKEVADFHFDWEDDFYQESLDIGDADIRNALTLSYRDKETGERVTLNYRDFPQLKNQESIDEYGKRAMQIEEADTSLIDSMAKAISFGEKIIWDLSELSATDRLDLPLFPQLDIFSTFTVENPLVSSTVDFYAVQSIRHSMTFGENGRFRTEVIATGRVVGARSKWTDMETRPGRPGKPIDPDRIPPDSLPPDRLPDYSLGVDKFMEGLKPPIMVTSKPDFPDPRYPIDTILFYTQDGRLYRVVGNDWVPMVVTDFSELNGKLQSNQIALEAITEELIAANAITKTKIADGSIETPKLAAGAVAADKIAANAVTANKINAGAVTAEKIAAGAIQTQHLEAGAVTAEKLDANAVTADMVVAGIIQAGGIKADWYADIRNVLPYVGADSLDQNHPIEVDFYIPSETTNIVKIMLSAKGLRYRAYARTAAAGGSHTHSVTIPGHTHTLTVSTRTYNREVTKSGGAHTHGIGGVTDSTQTVASLTLSQGGAHSHSLGADGLGLPTSRDEHSHTASASSAGGHTHTLAISEYKHTHKVRGDVSSVSNHTHGISVTTGSHSHSHSGSISSSGSHAHILEIDSIPHSHTVLGTGASTSSHTHNHTGTTRKTGYIDVGNHTHDFTTDSASHSHTVSGNTAASGGHTHSVDLTTAQDAHSHTGSSIGAVSDHAHTITVGSYTHSHNVTGTTTTSGTHGGHVSDVSYAGHTHGIPVSEPHTHEFVYVDTEVGSVTGTTSITVDTTSVSETHTHNLIYNIALDTTPANVRLYCDNGSGYDAGRNLASAPGDNAQEYVLATELDLTNRFSGTGWKRIKFTSSRRGRIVWQLIIKLDLTA